MRLNEELIESHTIYRGRVVTLRIDTVRLPNGNTARREIVEHRGEVAIVPLLNRETVLLIRQYRQAVGETLLEIPAAHWSLTSRPTPAPAANSKRRQATPLANCANCLASTLRPATRRKCCMCTSRRI